MTLAAASEDWAGVVHAPAAGARIASLVPSITETLFALGLGDRVVARTGFCIHPRDAVRRVAKVGGTKDPDLGKLRDLAPTHLVVNVDENRREVVDKARAFVPNVVVTHPASPFDNVRLYRLLGGIFDRHERAEALVAGFERALEHAIASTRTLPRERVLYLIWRRPWMTVSRDTYIAATLALVGFDVVTVGTARYPEISDTGPGWREADRILLSTEPYAFRKRDAGALAEATGKRVELIEGEWTSWYGVRATGGVASLADFRVRGAAPG